MSLVISMFLEATTTSSFSMYMFVLDSPKIPTLSRTTNVCVSVFDKVSTILHEKLVVLDLEPKAMVESLQPTQSQNSWRSPIPKYYLKDALLLRQQKRSH
ncbi:hypothetical protein Bca52824_075603 [Brassica carinata]|uniref:Uncharacterized protein n=1 Tax=Brassica carinata TaxID=52824 RepID=A0A8X7PPX6_BRACI|nr:hypothetical protein Bca52824_075603 [Brassica carinata]